MEATESEIRGSKLELEKKLEDNIKSLEQAKEETAGIRLEFNALKIEREDREKDFEREFMQLKKALADKSK